MLLNNRGQTLRDLKRYEEAIPVFSRLLGLSPDLPYASGALLHARMMCCEWRWPPGEINQLSADLTANKRRISPFALLSISGTPEDQLMAARIWVRDKYPPAPAPLHAARPYRHGRIRLAYLSADLREHAVGNLAAGLIERHDRGRFEVTAVSFGRASQDAMHDRLKAAFDRFIDAREISDAEAARQIREFEIDIAVDMQGYTTDCRPGILALRPAPIQVSYLGYPGTMGAAYIDYLLADRIVIPPGEQRWYSEKVVHLPDSYMVTAFSDAVTTAAPSRRAAGLPESGFVFCAFHASYKITPRLFDVWMRLLRAVPGSVIWLRTGNEAAERNLRREAEAREVSADRLVFAGRVPRADHLARHRLADLFLDTLPYSAHTTAADALWAGLPVLTCPGRAFAGRVAASLVHAAGLPELAVSSLTEYERLALRLATDPAVLSAIKTKLRRSRASCPLFDTDRTRRHIERAYVAMWERWQRGEKPASFFVAAEGERSSGGATAPPRSPRPPASP